MGDGSGTSACAAVAGHPLAGAVSDPFWAGPVENCVLGSSQEVLGNLLRKVTSPNSPRRCQSSGGINPELGICLLVALTPTFMTLGNIKRKLIMPSLSSRERTKQQ